MKKCKHCSSKMHDFSISCSRCNGGINAPTRKEQSEVDENNKDECSFGFGLFLFALIVMLLIAASS
jgi:hypothetical protein